MVLIEYPCIHDGCSKFFKRKGDLTRHQLLHTGIRPHQCRECRRGFAQASALKTHLNTHTGAKPYKCPICDTRFGDPSSRTRHTKEKHEAKTRFRCPVANCTAAIKRGSSFRTHLRKIHGLSPEFLPIESYIEPLTNKYPYSTESKPTFSQLDSRAPTPPLELDMPSSITPPSLLPFNLSVKSYDAGDFLYDGYLTQAASPDSGPSCHGSNDGYVDLRYLDMPRFEDSISPSPSRSTISPFSLSPCPTPPPASLSPYHMYYALSRPTTPAIFVNKDEFTDSNQLLTANYSSQFFPFGWSDLNMPDEYAGF